MSKQNDMWISFIKNCGSFSRVEARTTRRTFLGLLSGPDRTCIFPIISEAAKDAGRTSYIPASSRPGWKRPIGLDDALQRPGFCHWKRNR